MDRRKDRKMTTPLTEVKENVDSISNFLKLGGEFIAAMQEFGEVVATAVKAVQKVLEEINDEAIKRLYQVKTAKDDLVMVTEKAFEFLALADDVVCFCKGEDMTAAMEDLRYFVNLQHAGGLWGAIWRGYYSVIYTLTRTPDLYQLRRLLNLLGHFLAKSEESYLAFRDACDTAIRSCTEAAEICARKAKEARNKKNATRIVGGTTSGLALGTGVALLASTVATVATGGLAAIPAVTTAAAGAVVAGGVGTAAAATTHQIASDFAKTEASFRRIQRDFDRLLHFAYTLKQGVAQVHTNLENISTKADTIAHCAKNGNDCSVVQEALKHLHEVCRESHDTTSKCRNRMMDKVLELKFSAGYSP